MQQLLTIEDFNPYLVEDTDHLWEMHCKRRFRGKTPEELESWREMFLRLQDEQEAKFATLTKNIKAAQEKCVPVKKTKLAYVDSYVKPPRNVLKNQERYGTNRLATVSPATRVAALDGLGGGNLVRTGDAKLRVANAIREAVPAREYLELLLIEFVLCSGARWRFKSSKRQDINPKKYILHPQKQIF